MKSAGKKPKSLFNRIAYIQPRFFIIGAQKCGTTSLYGYLTQHPAFGAARRKEIAYFTQRYHLGQDWYRRMFPKRVDQLRTLLRHGQFYTGEATPSYMFYPRALEKLAKDFPKARFIIVLRNPVDRAYSHYQHSIRLGKEPLGFSDALAAEKERTDTAWARQLKEGGRPDVILSLYTYLRRGIYSEQIEHCYKLLSKESIYITDSESLFKSPEKTVADIQRFLGVKNTGYRIKFDRLNASKTTESMMSDTREYLMSYYQPYNERLFKVIGRRFDWD